MDARCPGPRRAVGDQLVSRGGELSRVGNCPLRKRTSCTAGFRRIRALRARSSAGSAYSLPPGCVRARRTVRPGCDQPRRQAAWCQACSSTTPRRTCAACAGDDGAAVPGGRVRRIGRGRPPRPTHPPCRGDSPARRLQGGPDGPAQPSNHPTASNRTHGHERGGLASGARPVLPAGPRHAGKIVRQPGRPGAEFRSPGPDGHGASLIREMPACRRWRNWFHFPGCSFWPIRARQAPLTLLESLK